ncbi:hypothetical protein FGRMN_7125 [Fusarium graminum]|nr:hypothetical protein FGRMN_7125 [Fusarium graminum]
MDRSGSDFSEGHELTYEEFQNLTGDYNDGYGDYEYGDPDWETVSDDSYLNHDWNNYIKDIPVLPSPRTRPLTPAGFRDDEPKDEQKLPIAALQKSAWFSIPPRLRQDILRIAFGDRIIHLCLAFDMYGALDAEEEDFGGHKPPVWGWIGTVCSREVDEMPAPQKHHGRYHPGPWIDTCNCVEFAKEFVNTPIDAKGWLMSCRQNYAETVDLVYSTNTFILTGEATIRHLPQILLPQRLSVMTSLEIVWETNDKTILKPIFDLLSQTRFPNLKRLVVSLEDGDADDVDLLLAQIDDFVKSRQGAVQCAFSIPCDAFDTIAEDLEPGVLNHVNEEELFSYQQLWRTPDGKMHAVRLPYVDSYPKPPFHLGNDAVVGCWLLEGEWL